MKHLRTRSLVLSLVGGLIFAVGGWWPTAAWAEGPPSRHPLHTALEELREAKREMEKSGHDYGGHKKAALEATDHAIKHLEKLLGWVKKHKKEELAQEFADEKYAANKGERHPGIHAAIFELKRARKYLEKSKHDFGDKKEKDEALKSVHHAIEQLDKALKFADEKKK